MDDDDVFAFEERRWEEEGWQRRRDKHAGQLKGQAASLTKRRVATFEWAESMVDQITAAHETLVLEPGERIGGKRLAKQLSAQGVVTRSGVDPVKLSDGGKKWADELVYSDESLIDEAVMECRTQMTAMCLSADFHGDQLGEFEDRYVEIIADILKLGRKLRNESIIGRADLLAMARSAAIEAARRQRQDKEPVTMAARERYWRGRPAPVRKVFEYRLITTQVRDDV